MVTIPQATIAELPPEETSIPVSVENPNNHDSVKETNEDSTVANLSSPWEFDDNQPYCANCACEFTPLNRKHHCRFCGRIFCNDCSKQRCLIPPSSIVLTPKGGKKAKAKNHDMNSIVSFSPDQDPDRMLTYVDGSNEGSQVLYGKGLEERFKLAREPLRTCGTCHVQLQPLQDDLRKTNSNAMRFNHIDPTDPRRHLNSPLAFTLGHEVRKAAYTLNNLLPLPKRMGAFISNGSSFSESIMNQNCKETCSGMSPSLGDLDGVRIPARLMEEAKGIATMTIVKGGFGLVGGEIGTGLVVARLSNGTWSAPSAIGAAGVSWGALIGAQISDHVFLLMTDDAVEMLFSNNGSVNLGADIGIAMGPLGRSLEGNFGASGGSMAPIYSYSLSKGLYAGVSLDGKVITTRHNVNEKFYGRQVSGGELLSGLIETPPAAQPLYDALARCHVYATGRNNKPPPRIEGIRNDFSLHNSMEGEYGETVMFPNAPSPSYPPPMMPPATDDHHSYVSDITNSTHR
mmetsp:Transcript_12572/g.18486  ORF Transcript_12572/g.18486 Transcript_12572/m.18486 type:complete len:514 (+) Transcript_12572:256-1797(+)